MANRRFNQFVYSFHKYPVALDCQFTVAATDSAGFGLTGLKGGGIQNVYMHTSATAAGAVNPAAGYIYIRLQDTYYNYYFGGFQVQSPVTGSEISISGSSVLTIGVPYQITTLGTSTVANWQAMGLPVGIAPALGVSFLAIATGSGTGTGKVKALGLSGVSAVELVGNANLTVLSSGATVASQANGSFVILKCLSPSFSGTALGTHTHDFTVIGGQIASTTNDIASYAGPLIGKQEAANATFLGANSATAGGVVAASAGTPAGTMSYAVAAPADGTVVRLKFLLSNSAILVQGD